MANTAYKPKSFIQMYALCIDDTLPKFTPIDWIKKDKLYRVKQFANALNLSEGEAVTITDASGAVLRPSPSHGSFNTMRFHFFEVVLN